MRRGGLGGPIARLSPDHEVVCPGFLDQPSIEAMAIQVLARAPGRFSLAGHSMGGRVALEIAARAPNAWSASPCSTPASIPPAPARPRAAAA